MTAAEPPLLSLRAEIERLESMDSGNPSTWLGPLEVRVRCSGDARAALARVKEVLHVVLTHLPESPSILRWKALLPSWFTGQCVEEVEPEDDRWSLDGWLEWFVEEERSWRYWDAVVVDEHTFVLRLISNGLPFAWGALEWLLACAGSTEIEPMF